MGWPWMAAGRGLERARLPPALPPHLASGVDLGWVQEGHDEAQADSLEGVQVLPGPWRPLQEVLKRRQGLGAWQREHLQRLLGLGGLEAKPAWQPVKGEGVAAELGPPSPLRCWAPWHQWWGRPESLSGEGGQLGAGGHGQPADSAVAPADWGAALGLGAEQGPGWKTEAGRLAAEGAGLGAGSEEDTAVGPAGAELACV